MRLDPPNRILMGPGPSNIRQNVLEAMSKNCIGHLDPYFVLVMDEIKAVLKRTFLTKSDLTFPVSAPGSAGMETCFANLVETDDKVIVCKNGVFGGRMQENVERIGGQAITVDDEWGRAVDLSKLEDALKSNSDVKIVAFVHGETSTGVLSDAQSIAKLAHQYNCLVIVDAVTTLGGSPLKVDEWELDAVYSGTQKCLSCTPGISPVSFSDRAINKIKNRKEKVQSWFLDLNLVMSYWASAVKRSYHHTAPVNAMYGLLQALQNLDQEGLEVSWQRHIDNHKSLKKGLEGLGMTFVVPEAERLPQLNAVSIPEGIDDASFRAKLLDKYSIEIGAGLGPLAGKIWRIGLMGETSRQENIELLLSALKQEL